MSEQVLEEKETKETEEMTEERQEEPMEKDPQIAFWGSIFFPGFAHVYIGKVTEGLVWSFMCALTYIFGIGLLMHIYLVTQAKKKVRLYNQGIDPVYSDIDYAGIDANK